MKRLTALALLLAACAPAETTRVKLRVSYDASWGLTRFEVTAEARTASANVEREVRVVLPDGWSGRELEIKLAGLRAGERYATGRVTVTPVLGGEVVAELTLARVPCGAWCTAGAGSCQGDATVTCEQRDSDACLEWSEPTACPAAAPFCSFGVCRATCVDECAPGERRCEGPSAVRVCGASGSSICQAWQPPVACGVGETCSNGACGKTCQDECTAGEVRCLGGGTVTCGDLDNDGCLEWGPVAPCAAGASCSSGQCATSCGDECTASRCDGTTFRTCGQFDLDSCQELSPGTSCVPADPCLEGACTSTGCQTTPRVCNTPPASSCVGPSTLRVYDASGLCGAGNCSYQPHDVACANCPSCDPCAGVVCNTPPSGCFAPTGTCSGGACSYPYANGGSCDDGNGCTSGDSCAMGVCAGTPKTCTTPPPPTCASPTTRRTFGAGGSCAGGACSYPTADMMCANGCQAGVCKPPACMPGVWAASMVDGVASPPGTPVSLAVDGQGGVHYAYYDGANLDLKYAYRPAGGSFTTTTVDSAGDVGTNPAIAVDAQGGVHIAYGDNSNRNLPMLKYAHRAPGGSWSATTVDAAASDNSTRDALAVDDQGGVHIVYFAAPTNIRYAYRAPGGSWNLTTIDQGGQLLSPSMVVDAQRAVHLAYVTGFGTLGTLFGVYAEKTPTGSWSVDTSTVGGATSIALAVDLQRGVHMIHSTDLGKPYQYRPAGGAWSTRPTFNTESGGRVFALGMAADAAGGLHVALEDGGYLAYQHRTPAGTWTSAVADDDAYDAFELALDGQGGVHIAYTSASTGGVPHYAYLACP